MAQAVKTCTYATKPQEKEGQYGPYTQYGFKFNNEETWYNTSKDEVGTAIRKGQRYALDFEDIKDGRTRLISAIPVDETPTHDYNVDGTTAQRPQEAERATEPAQGVSVAGIDRYAWEGTKGTRHGMLFGKAWAAALQITDSENNPFDNFPDAVRHFYRVARDLDDEMWLITLGDQEVEAALESAQEIVTEAQSTMPIPEGLVLKTKGDFLTRAKAQFGMDRPEVLKAIGLSVEQFTALPDASLPERYKQLEGIVMGNGPEPVEQLEDELRNQS